MRFKFEYSTLHLSPIVWKRQLNKELRAALIEGGTLWMNAALTRIPVWSGASHGTFLKLAAKLGYQMSVGGAGFGGGPSYGEAHSSAKLTVYAGAYILEYNTNLWHLIYNEYNDANAHPEAGRLFAKLHRPGPYKFQDSAGEEFKQFAKTVRLPSPKLALTTKTKVVK